MYDNFGPICTNCISLCDSKNIFIEGKPYCRDCLWHFWEEDILYFVNGKYFFIKKFDNKNWLVEGF